jgi:hypothetical protein
MSQTNRENVQQLQGPVTEKVYVSGVSDNQDYDLAWCPADHESAKDDRECFSNDKVSSELEARRKVTAFSLKKKFQSVTHHATL